LNILFDWLYRNEKFDQIVKINQENIRRLISNEDYQSNLDSIDDKQLIEEILNKTKNSFNAGIVIII
jgi:vacuolar-type H+-ATPase subunit C/Vma6